MGVAVEMLFSASLDADIHLDIVLPLPFQHKRQENNFKHMRIKTPLGYGAQPRYGVWGENFPQLGEKFPQKLKQFGEYVINFQCHIERIAT